MIFFNNSKKKPAQEWPNSENPKEQNLPFFLFILTLPYSGSTALAQVLNTAPGSMLLNENAEGQWLVPGMCAKDRWNPNKTIQWDSVMGTWKQKIKEIEKHVGQINLVIEKSPPNIVRTDTLLSHFKDYALVVLNRNPYAYCSSVLYRTRNGEQLEEKERIDALKVVANKWMIRSRYARQQIKKYNPVTFSYEDFCAAPEAALARIQDIVPALSGITLDATVKVKDYPPQGIVNQNPRQISRLSDREKATIGEILSADEPLLNAFGYTSSWKARIEDGGAKL